MEMKKATQALPAALILAWTVWAGTACNSPSAPDPEPTPTPQPAFDYNELIKQFSYDASAPLDIQMTGTYDLGAGTNSILSYASPKGGRVTASLVIPKGAGPFPAVIYMHEGREGVDKSEFQAEALQMAALGAASIAIDAPFRRPVDSGTRGDSMYIQNVIDLRRAADLLLARADIDPQRLAYVGHSFGGTWGGVLAGADKRFLAFVLMCGHPEIGNCTACKENVSEGLWAVHYIDHAAPADVFFQFARQDEYITEAAANKYYTTASSPKSMSWYDATHSLNDLALTDRIAWLKSKFGI